MMKIALTRRTEKTHHLNYSILMKRICQIKTVKLVPVFAARWRAICKYFINSENKQPGRRYRIQQQNKEKTPHAYTQGKRNSTQPSQSHYYSHFYFNKQAYAQYELALQKEQRMPRVTLWSYHPYLMKALNGQNNQMVINPLQSRLITLNEEDPPHRNREDSSNFRH